MLSHVLLLKRYLLYSNVQIGKLQHHSLCLVSLQILNNGEVENQAQIDVWDQKDVDARMIIYCNIEPKLQVLLEGCRTAADMWDRLILQFAQAAAANANLLLNKFANYQYEQGAYKHYI